MKRAVILCGLTGYAFIVLLTGCAKLGQEKSVPPVSRPPSEALAEYSMAVRSGMEGDADAVIKHYKSAIKEDPDNTDLKTELALILLHQGDFNGTVAVSDEIIALDRRNIKAYQMKALALRIAGRKEDSLLSLESAAAIKPKEAQLHIDVAGMLVHMKESRKAISYLEKKKHLVKDKQKIEEALGELYTAETRIALASKQDIPAAYLDNMKAASREYPSNEKIHILCGELLVLNGEVNEALAHFDRAAEISNDPVDIRRKIGASIAAIPDRKNAITYVKNATEKNPVDQRLSIYLSELYELDDQTDESIRVLDQAIAQPSADQETYIRLIRACFKGKQIDKALDVTRAALVRFPDEHRLYELQGYIFLQTRNFTNSVAAFAQAEKIITRSKSQPLLKTFYLHAAEANQRAGDLERAAELLRTGYTFEDDIIEQFMMSAFEFDSAPGQVEAALEVLDKISDLLPREPGTYATFGLLAMRAENYPASLSMFEQARELALEAGEEDEALDAQFYFWLGSAAERNRQYDKAEEYFLQAIRLQPDHADAHNYLAYMNAERGVRLDAAMDHVAVALAVEPENPAYIDTRGWIYYRLGDYTNALADIARAFELMPNDPTIADHLGDIYMKLDNHEEARTYWEKSLNFEPANTNIVIKLQRFQNDDQASEAELNTDAGSAGPEVERLPALDPALRE